MLDRPPRLGLAITTYNRRDTLLRALAEYRRLTSVPFDLVVCDDGSSDGTIDAVRELGVTVLGGVNRGIAWNKNRGLWHLANTCRCDVILLVDDDVAPVLHGWEQEWIAAVARVGHVNFIPPHYYDDSLVGPRHMRASSLGVSSVVGGMVLAQSAQALAHVGYMDPRFGRYGHEHTDFSNRFLRAGFGGFCLREDGRSRWMYHVISGGLELVPSKSNGDADDIAKNGTLLGQLAGDPIYRSAWRSDAEMLTFQAEVCAPYLAGLTPVVPQSRAFSPSDYLRQNDDVLRAGEPALAHYLRCGHTEGRLGGFVAI
ncbi:MAG: glycosyltransferase family 2 protein [Janthinobacterium lividum]